jgi:hypothetical protein
VICPSGSRLKLPLNEDMSGSLFFSKRG